MKKDQEVRRETLLALRRRWVWPAYAAAVIIGGGLALLAAEAEWWFLLGGLMILVGAFDLSISAREYVLRKQRIEAAIVWLGVLILVIGAVATLFTWWRMVTDVH